MNDIVYPACAILAITSLIYTIPRYRRDPARRALLGLTGFLVLVFLADTPAIYVDLDALVGVPNLAKLVVHGGVISVCLSWQSMLSHWVHPPALASRSVRRWTAGYLLTFVLMAWLFLTAPVHQVEATNFTAVYGGVPRIGVYTAVYLTYIALTLIDIIGMSRRFARSTVRPFLRYGLTFQVVGAIFGAIYVAEKALYVLSISAHHPLPPPAVQTNLSPLLTGPSGILVLTGLALPSAGPVVATFRRYRQLYPLWHLVTQATPEVVLPSSAPWGLEYRLLRRIGEIRDGQLALRPWLAQDVADTAVAAARRAGLDDDHAAAIVEAALLLAAAHAKAHDRRPERAAIVTPRGSANMADETTWLLAVAHALRHPAATSCSTPVTTSPLE